MASLRAGRGGGGNEDSQSDEKTLQLGGCPGWGSNCMALMSKKRVRRMRYCLETIHPWTIACPPSLGPRQLCQQKEAERYIPEHHGPNLSASPATRAPSGTPCRHPTSGPPSANYGRCLAKKPFQLYAPAFVWKTPSMQPPPFSLAHQQSRPITRACLEFSVCSAPLRLQAMFPKVGI